MKKYKLLRAYPGLPKDWEVGMEVGLGDRVYAYSPCNVKYSEIWVDNPHVEDYPEYWQEIIEQTPYRSSCIGKEIIGVTRLSDGVYFNKGMCIKMPDDGSLGFIYKFEEKNGRLIIDHTFSFLMNEAGYKDHLAHLRPCIYTKEDLMR